MNLRHLSKNKLNPITIKEASISDLFHYQNHVQKYDKNESSKSWNWPRFAALEGVMAKTLKQDPKFLTIESNNIPIGMMMIANKFKAEVTRSTKEDLTYIWYLSGADKEYLDKMEIDKSSFDISIGKALIDAAMVESLKAGNDGKILLHADPKDKTNFLLDYYKGQGLSKIATEHISNISSTRANDGRFFHATKSRAGEILYSNRLSIGQDPKELYQSKSTIAKGKER